MSIAKAKWGHVIHQLETLIKEWKPDKEELEPPDEDEGMAESDQAMETNEYEAPSR